MYSDLESNESKRREVVSSLYWSLMQGWNIPLSIQKYYGLTEDYRLFHQLEGMAPDEYLRKRQAGLEYSSFHTGVLRTHGGLPSVPSA